MVMKILKQFKRPIDALSVSSLFHYKNVIPNDLKKIYKIELGNE